MGQGFPGTQVVNQSIKDALAALEKCRRQVSVMVETVRADQVAVSRATSELKQRLQGSHDAYAAAREREALQQRLEVAAILLGAADVAAAQLEVAVQGLARGLDSLGSHLESASRSRELGLSIIKAQDEERRRVAREIHDGPAQLLANVVLRIDVCQRLFESDPARLREELSQLKDLVRLSLQDVRKIIFDLRPMALDDLGLVPALRAYLKEYQAKTAVETDFNFFGAERRYDNAFEVAMFRLVQEALTNVSKHARATQVWVKVELTGGGRELKIAVRDNGQGFDVERVRQGGKGNFGLLGMQERVELLGGRMEIISSPGHGTRLNFNFPVNG